MAYYGSMSEAETVSRTHNGPHTISSLVKDFKNAGLQEGLTVIVHSSLQSIGWVCGGPVTIIHALEQVLTEEGTLIMPAHSGDLSDPALWENPPVPEDWWPVIRQEMPCFDKFMTPTRGIGVVPETFRKQDSVVRSEHPQLSFCAWGKHKDYVTADHHYSYALNKESPLGKIYDLDGYVFLIGVSHEHNTSLHLAEYLASYSSKKRVPNGMPVHEHGRQMWKTFEDIELSSDDFELIGQDFEKEHEVITGKAGNAQTVLVRQRSLVDFAVTWMESHRQ